MAEVIMADLVVRNAAYVCTCAGPPAGEAAAGAIAGGAVAVAAGKIVWVGPERDLWEIVETSEDGEVLDAEGGLVTPGLVDAHTHLLYAGERSAELSDRLRGRTYLEIAQAGGGIQATVKATRAASDDELVTLASARLGRLLAHGVTTCEVKSGYGLDPAGELRLLRAIASLTGWPVRVVATLLVAHSVPRDWPAGRAAYLEALREELIPQAAAEGLCASVDTWVDAGALSLDEGRALLETARGAGLKTRLHADQLAPTGAARLAAELGCLSADHLERASHGGLSALARAGVVGTILPTATLFLRDNARPPGRALLDVGGTVALGTNLNPGSAPTENTALTFGLACLSGGLLPEEALRAFTAGSAQALGLAGQLGVLAPGAAADLVIHGAPDVSHLAYHLGVPHVRVVVRAGTIVHDTRGHPGDLRCV